MPHRRILSLWFPRLGAQQLIRAEPHLLGLPLAVVRDEGQAQVLSSLSSEASKLGLHLRQPLRDAYAMCGELITRPQNERQEAVFLGVLHRWAGKFSPWVAAAPPDALVIDLTGCAHLFGGEEQLAEQVAQDCADLGLSVRLGIADTLGAAWALARFTAQDGGVSHRSGDAIDQEARATRSRAGKRRHWTRGGAAPRNGTAPSLQDRIAPVGKTWQVMSPLPVAALRIDPQLVDQLNRLGLRRVGDLIGQPRAGLARRFGRGLVDKMDQAIGSAPEPISPAKPPERFSVRLSFPEPIGLEEDVAAGLARMLDQLCTKLKAKGRGARTLRIEAHRCDGQMEWQQVSAAVASCDTHRLMPLLRMKLPEIEAGPGIDMLRLEATGHDAMQDRRMAGHAVAAARGKQRKDQGAALEDLLGRIGARIGMDAITRKHPASSHIPEKCATVLAAAWSDPAEDWPEPPTPRPLLMWPAEAVTAPDTATPPKHFHWRGRPFETLTAKGPERIAPEWWLDEPAWRSGPRDYWRVVTDHGDRLWLYYAHGGTMSSGWFCQGSFS
ncbi:DNA polymerase Y family protein [uncultured Pelagimonas sp.]|uniref:Y-family DNA polymerase n=1 Tax=uncultured Pelagimonas sp. TaxID=1618102 RepID=UPI00260540B9|nr:DNA polymerase Y family protein [uncultured Pelagimonas sp.]